VVGIVRIATVRAGRPEALAVGTSIVKLVNSVTVVACIAFATELKALASVLELVVIG
jgi:hypothetical protein